MSVTRHLLHHPHSDLSAPTSDQKHLDGGDLEHGYFWDRGKGIGARMQKQPGPGPLAVTALPQAFPEPCIYRGQLSR